MGIRRFLLLHFFAFVSILASAQKGTIKGEVYDAKTNEALIGATVMLEGTTIGSVTDFDGNFLIEKIDPGTYNVRCSFISYETNIQENVSIASGQELVIEFNLGESTVEIEGVNVVAKANRESESMLLIDQKNASGIKESIGSKRMSSLGVSDAASATTKISGVTKNEGSGDVYIRGLGDRYLTTTMNGLPIPSDDVDKKNIDLNLFSTDIIKNVGINKTFSVEMYGDQSSGSVNISSKTFSEKITLELSTKANSNVIKSDIWSDFRTTQNMNDVSLGLYQRAYTTEAAIKQQSWNAAQRSTPLGFDFSLTAGNKFKLFDNNFTVFATVSHENSYEYHNGIYKKYRSNVLGNSFTDAETYNTKVTTTGLVNLAYEFNSGHNLNLNSLLVSKANDQLYEAGRNGEGYIYDQLPRDSMAFVRDQNLKETTILINQLLGSHKLNEKNVLKWAVGFNSVSAEEPNRIRNQVHTMYDNTVQFAYVGDYQQKKSLQDINDWEINGYLNDELKFIDKEDKKLKLDFGGNFRMKERDFNSLSVGVRGKGVGVASFDNLDEALRNESLYTDGDLRLRVGTPDLYSAILTVYAGYLHANFELNKLSGVVGLRYERDEIEVNWDVANYVGRKGDLSNSYDNIFPGVNLKYQLTNKSSLRLAASKTTTLPEFKELSPFEYVSPTGRVTKGNPDLKNSVNYNLDLKWEMFPSAKELFSVTGFYKRIQDPINLAQARGSSGNFIFENTGDQADVYGFEVETRLELIAGGTETPGLNLSMNATKMWFNQDLLEVFQYNSKTETDLQGAAGFIVNGTLSYSDNKENEFTATLSGNYSSDKILALGAPEDFVNSATLFNNEIVEKGFATVDLVLSKKISKTVSLKFSGKNLLNPSVEQTQEIKPLSGDVLVETVSSYKRGINLSLGVRINLSK